MKLKRFFLVLMCSVALISASAEPLFSKDAITDALLTLRESADSVIVDKVLATVDSVLNRELVSATVDDNVAYDDNRDVMAQIRHEEIVESREMRRDAIRCAAFFGILVFASVILIVIIALVFNYRKRTARYRMINKAIENNYEIPEYLVSERQVIKQPVVHVNLSQFNVKPEDTTITDCGQQPLVAPIMPQAQGYTGMNNGSFNDILSAMSSNPMYSKEMRKNVVFVVIGIAGFLAFMSCGGSFMAWLFIVPLLIGVGRFWLLYLQCRGDMARTNQVFRMTSMQNTAAPAAQQPSQPATGGNSPEPPVELPND